MTASINPVARKAVLIMEGEDGSAVVSTIYDPRIDREFSAYDYGTTRLVAGGSNRLTFVSGKGFLTSRTDEDLRQKAVGVYDEGARAFSGTKTVPVMASEDEIRKWIQERHEDALHAVYLAGVLQGAEQVKFNDAYFEKQLAEAPVKALNRAYSEIAMAHASAEARGKPWAKGLERALRTVTEIRQLFAEKVPQ